MNLFARIRANGAGAGQSRGFSQDQFVKASASDSTGGYLSDKLTAGNLINIAVSSSANQSLVVRSTVLDYLNTHSDGLNSDCNYYLPWFRNTLPDGLPMSATLKNSFFRQGWTNQNVGGRGYTNNVITLVIPSGSSSSEPSPNESEDQAHYHIFRSWPGQGGCGFVFQRNSNINTLVILGGSADAAIVKDNGDVQFYQKVISTFFLSGVQGSENLYLNNSSINAEYDDPGDCGTLILNATGYHGGVTKFRRTTIKDGKGNIIATFDGNATAALSLTGKIQIGSSGVAYQEKVLTGTVGATGSTTNITHGLPDGSIILSISAVIRPLSVTCVFPNETDTSRLYSVRADSTNVNITIGGSASVLAYKGIELVVRYK